MAFLRRVFFTPNTEHHQFVIIYCTYFADEYSSISCSHSTRAANFRMNHGVRFSIFFALRHHFVFFSHPMAKRKHHAEALTRSGTKILNDRKWYIFPCFLVFSLTNPATHRKCGGNGGCVDSEDTDMGKMKRIRAIAFVHDVDFLIVYFSWYRRWFGISLFHSVFCLEYL